MAFEIFEAPSDMQRLIMELSKAVYPVPMSESEFTWKYFGNPAGKARVWFARDRASGLVCGSWSLFPWYMTIGTEEILCAQAGDLMVLPEFRRRGLFRYMVESSIQPLKESNIKALIAFPETFGLSYKGFIRFEWKNLTFLKTYKRPVDMAHFSKGICENLVSRVLKPITFLYNANHGLRRRRHRNMRFERISLFDERYNELLDQEVDASKSFVSRRCSYLNWRFLKHPRNDYLAYSLSESGKVRGYIILRLKEKQACIVDIYPLTDRHVVNLLISFTIGLLTTREEDILICRCSDPVGSYLKKSGFFEREVSLQFVMHTIDSTNNLALHSASKEWALMSGDVDIG